MDYSEISYQNFIELLKCDDPISEIMPIFGETNLQNCPFSEVLQGKWKNKILFSLCNTAPIRFGDLKKRIPGITNTSLTNALHELEDAKLISRTQYAEIPPRVEYCLTPIAEELMPMYYETFKWTIKYLNYLKTL